MAKALQADAVTLQLFMGDKSSERLRVAGEGNR